jgi:hypothetical protein
MNKQTIITLLEKNDKSVARALVAINEKQTRVEQNTQSTRNNNGVGFTPADAFMGTSMAQFYSRNGFLSEKQLAYWKRTNAKGVPRIAKYAGQLLTIAQENEEAKFALEINKRDDAEEDARMKRKFA